MTYTEQKKLYESVFSRDRMSGEEWDMAAKVSQSVSSSTGIDSSALMAAFAMGVNFSRNITPERWERLRECLDISPSGDA